MAANPPKEYWLLALKHACFLRNISPTKAVEDSPHGTTPYQQARGRPFDVTLMQKWDRTAYTRGT